MKTTLSRLRLAPFIVTLAFCTAAARAQTLSPPQQFQEAIHLMEDKGDYPGAIKLFEELVKGQDRSLAARALLYLGLCYEKTGKEIARQKYQQLINDFADQPKVVAEARARLSAIESETSSATEPRFIVRRVWSCVNEAIGEPSPDGRHISYANPYSGGVGMIDLSTGETRLLTSKSSQSEESEGYPESSIFSADGNQIAYDWLNTQKVRELRTIGVDGSGLRVVAKFPDAGYFYPTDWSSDGRYILVNLFEKNGPQIGLVAVADGSVRTLKTFQRRYPNKMNFSPDGRYIVYDFPQSEDSYNRDIFLLPTDGSSDTPQPLVEYPAHDYLLAWVPDGKHILFASDRTGSFGAWLQEVAEGKPRGCPELIRRDIGAVSPKGFTRKGSYFYEVQTGLRDVNTLDLDPATGLPVSQATTPSHRFVGSNSSGSWSRDGKFLAYVSALDLVGRGPSAKYLIIRSVDTGEERELLPKMIFLNELRLSWSPDGKSVLDTGTNDDGQPGIHQVDVQTGRVTTLRSADPDSWIFVAIWSPDGKTIFYSAVNWNGNSHQLIARDVVSGQEREVYRPQTDIRQFDISPDGRWLAFGEKDSITQLYGLKVISTGGGEPRELIRSMKDEYIVDVAWMPTGRHVLFAKAFNNPQQYQTGLWRVSVEDGAAQSLGVKMDLSPHPRPSPDGRKLAFTGGRSFKSEVWVMENFLPATEGTK